MLARRERGEGGAVALMVALSSTVLLISAALVFDFGVARVDRAANQLAADAAATAGIRSMEDVDGSHKPWRAGCAALAYLRVNGPQFSDLTGSWAAGTGGAVAGNPCSSGSSLLGQTCVPNDSSTWAWYNGTADGGSVSVDIRSGYTLPDPSFPEDQAMNADDGASSAGGCDQLAVIITESDQPGLGRLATSSATVTRVRSVARVIDPVTTQDVPALLLLERHACLALDVNGYGPYVSVLGNGAAPGSIHSDSLGDGANCSNTNKVINGNTTIPGVVAHKAETGGRPGVITVAALSGAPGAIASNASDPSPADVNAEGQPGGAPTGRTVVGRGYADQRFLPYVQAAISNAVNQWSATSPPAGFTKYTGSCNKITGNIPGQYVFFPCTTASFSNATLPNAQQVIITGALNVPSNATLALPVVQSLSVKGASGTGVNIQGNLSMNDAGTSACPSLSSARARFVVGQGSFSAGAQAQVRMCGTAVIMADNSGSPGCPLPATVTFPGPAPYSNGCSGTINVGGGGNLQWTAPNATLSAPSSTDKAALEDLALWTETSAPSTIGGSGVMTVAGVFVAPNADPFKIAGTSSQSNGADAQFITRRLELDGNGKLTMRPNPNDAVSIPAPAQYELVR